MQLLQLNKQDCNEVVCCEAETYDNSGREVACVDVKDFTCQIVPYATYLDKTGTRYSVPDGAILSAVQTAANDFARQTHVMQRTFKMRTQVGVADYYIEPLEGEEVHLIQSVCVNGRVLSPLRGVEKCGDPFALWASASGQFSCCGNTQWLCEYFMFLVPDKLVLRTAPDTLDNCSDIIVNYIAVPSFTACKMDRILYSRYRSAIIKGAAENLLTMPGWEWTSPGFGVKAGKNFDAYIADARIDMSKGFSTGSQSAITMDRF